MIKKALAGVGVAAALAVSGCATTSGSSITVQDVQNAAVLACSFLPTAASVAAIIAAGRDSNEQGVETATAIANAICSAVVPKSAKLKGAVVPEVNGVPVHGRFLK